MFNPALQYLYGRGYSPEVLSMIAVAQSNGYTLPSNSRLTALNNLVVTLKAIGVYSKCDYIRVSAFNDVTLGSFATIPVKSPAGALATKGADVSYTAKGFKGDNNTGDVFVNTQCNLGTTTHYVQNNACRLYMVWPGPQVNIDGANGNSTNQFHASNVNTHRINQNTVNLSASVNMSGDGLKAICRDNSTNVRLTNKSVETSVTATSQSVPSLNQLELRSFSARSTSTIGFTLYSSSLSTTEIADVRTAINNYLTAIGLTADA